MGRTRIVLVGSAGSTLRTLEGLVRNDCHVVGVLGCGPDVDLAALSVSQGIPYFEFESLGAKTSKATLRSLAPDVLFIVGLSQLADDEVLAIPHAGTVGFHPTRLPRMRGRAPIAWLILEQADGAATFFAMDAGVDTGPILVQEPFQVGDGDYASDVLSHMDAAIDRALDRWLPKLRESTTLEGAPQDEADASFRGRRAPKDGEINWSASAIEIARLVRATSRPHPGARTFYAGSTITIWRAAAVESECVGAVGRVLRVGGDSFLVQTGDGCLEVLEFETEAGASIPGVGARLTIAVEAEIAKLRADIEDLKQQL